MKLAKKLTSASSVRLQDINPLGSWHGNLYVIDHRQCIMFSHDKTRFTMFAAGLKKRDFENLDFWFQDLFANTMLKLQYPTSLIESALSSVDQFRFDTACDRSVQGTMLSARLQDLEGMLMGVRNVMDLPIYSTSARLNERPVHIKGMKSSQCLWPVEAMKEFLSELQSGPGEHSAPEIRTLQ